MTNQTSLIYTSHPSVVLSTNTFVNVPIIFQFDDIPLIQIVKELNVGHGIEIPIYHNDGTKLAVVKANRIFLTNNGENSGLKLLHPDKMTVCKLGDKTLFEIRRDDAAAVSIQAELNTHTGYFVKLPNNSELELMDNSGTPLELGGLTMSDSTISGCKIGIHMLSSGSVSIGVY